MSLLYYLLGTYYGLMGTAITYAVYTHWPSTSSSPPEEIELTEYNSHL